MIPQILAQLAELQNQLHLLEKQHEELKQDHLELRRQLQVEREPTDFPKEGRQLSDLKEIIANKTRY